MQTQNPGVNLQELQNRIAMKFGTQSAFAEACGVSRQYISQVLKGEVMPSLSRIIQFATLLDVTVDSLLEKEEALEPAM